MSQKINQITDRYPDEEFLQADGLDEAIIGVDEQSMRLIYSESKCIEILAKEMPEDEAREFYNFNIKDAYVGEKTPIWCSSEFN